MKISVTEEDNLFYSTAQANRRSNRREEMQEGVVKDKTISLSSGLSVLPHVPCLWQNCGLVH
jgi:hypothetical protein